MLFIVLFLFSIFQAQPLSEADSLLQAAANTQDDTSKIILISFAASALQYSNPEKADSLNFATLEKSKELKFVKGIDYGLTNLSSVRIVQGDYKGAMEYIDQLLLLADKENLPDTRIKALNRRAVVQYYLGQYQEGIKTNLRVLELNQTSGNERSILNAFNNIGINYERLGELDKAIEYYDQALQKAHQLNHNYSISAIAANIAVIYKNRGQLDQAREKFEESIATAEKIDNASLLIDELANLGEVLILQKDIQEATKINQRLFSEAQKFGDQNGLIKAYAQKGKIDFSKGKFGSAIQQLERALQISETTKDKEELLSIYDFLNRTHFQMNHAKKAYEYLNLYSARKDSIFNIEKTNELNRLETLYQVAEKDKEILQQELEIQNQSRQRNLFLTGIIIVGLIGIFTYLYLHRTIKSNKKIEAQNREIQSQKIAALVKENKILALDAMIMGQEEERKRIAQDLHDSLGSLMATVKGHFSAIQNEIEKLSELNLYKKTDHLIDKACDEVRRISHNMMPKTLIDNGLRDAVQDLAETFGVTNNLTVDCDISGIDDRLSDKVEVTIFRIIQELLSNISKHANASSVLIQMLKKENNLHLTIEDNGLGFDVNATLNSQGLGLKSIRSRIEYINGELEIDSVPNEGTTVMINVPLTKQNSSPDA